MSIKSKKLIKLFTSTFALSAFTFGGGYVIIPLMKKKFVDQLDWIDEKEMLNFTAIAQSSPGPIAVNASILLGFHVAGPLGAFISILGTVLPPLIILSVISLFYTVFCTNPVAKAVLKGMQAGVAAVIVDVVFKMIANISKDKSIVSDIVMAGAFAASFFIKINVVLIIIACGIVGTLQLLVKTIKKKGNRQT